MHALVQIRPQQWERRLKQRQARWRSKEASEAAGSGNLRAAGELRFPFTPTSREGKLKVCKEKEGAPEYGRPSQSRTTTDGAALREARTVGTERNENKKSKVGGRVRRKRRTHAASRALGAERKQGPLSSPFPSLGVVFVGAPSFPAKLSGRFFFSSSLAFPSSRLQAAARGPTDGAFRGG